MTMDMVHWWFWPSLGLGVLAFIRYLGMRARRRDTRASHGGVAIGGNNYGTVVTRRTEHQRSSNETWTLVVSILSLAVAALAWLLPRH